MTSVPLQNPRAVLDRILDGLDHKAQRAQARSRPDSRRGHSSCQRRHPRHAFRRECLVRFFGSAAREIATLPGRTRNISRSGMSLLVKRLFAPGEAIEIQLRRRQSQVPTFLAGKIRFSRYAARGYYEIGVALHGADEAPVFSKNPEQAINALDWLRDARFPL